MLALGCFTLALAVLAHALRDAYRAHRAHCDTMLARYALKGPKYYD
jgi:hypothetical protein